MKDVNIALLSHERMWVDDQVRFLEISLKDCGFRVTIQKDINPDFFNFVIEGVSHDYLNKNIGYLRKNPGKFAVVLTENFDLTENRTPILNGMVAYSDGSEKQDPNFSPINRLRNLIELSQYSKIFVTCGTVPNLNPYKEVFRNHILGVIPWPKLQIPAYNNELNNRLFFSTPHKDTYTQHRVDMISKIESLGIGVDIEFGLSSQLWEEKIRDYVGVLDIPKSNNWPWPSPMRTFRAISNGKLVYSSRIETNKLNGISSIFEIPIFDLKAQMLTLKQESSELQATYNFMYKRQNFEFISMLSEYIHSM